MPATVNLQQIIIAVFAILGILCAVIAFIKTPKSERFRLPQHPKKAGVEYAPEYTTQEKIQLLIKYLVWAIPTMLVFKFWFFPWLNQYAANAHCLQYGHFSGLDVLLFGTLIGLPLVFSVLLFFTIGRRYLKVIKLGQDPLPNEKTLRPTPYIYGAKAKLKAYFGLALIFFLFCLCFQGYFVAQSFSKNPPKSSKLNGCKGASLPPLNTK